MRSGTCRHTTASRGSGSLRISRRLVNNLANLIALAPVLACLVAICVLATLSRVGIWTVVTVLTANYTRVTGARILTIIHILTAADTRVTTVTWVTAGT